MINKYFQKQNWNNYWIIFVYKNFTWPIVISRCSDFCMNLFLFMTLTKLKLQFCVLVFLIFNGMTTKCEKRKNICHAFKNISTPFLSSLLCIYFDVALPEMKNMKQTWQKYDAQNIQIQSNSSSSRSINKQHKNIKMKLHWWYNSKNVLCIQCQLCMCLYLLYRQAKKCPV